MYERQIELTVGQAVRVGEVLVTIVEIDDDEVHLRIDDADDDPGRGLSQRELVLALPR